ncbi:hypothetical protein PDJAM_G00029270 [Pangasius djambal]|uniref:Uncharacterized protein n=1 Tax=Pangasius djambal TaxID=1691987 RepID=A0ACC5YQN5_9TELE|nr:hypothetical protein [Pangasius djambal]
MAASKSSHTMRNIVIIFLALWSIISLIIIVVWATSPDLKGASECNANLKTLKEKFAEEKDIWAKDRHALEELVRQGRTNQSLLLTRMDQLKDQLQKLNQSLDSCLKQKDMLNDNITVLMEEIDLHKAIEANLTAKITQQQDVIELLQYNLTQTLSELESCTDLQKAAQILQTAAEKQTQGCQSSKQFLQKQLEKCKSTPQTSSKNDGPPGPRSGIFLVGLLCISFLLIPCKYSEDD